MTTNIYVLRLEGGRYYVGKSDNILERYYQHTQGNGSAWTKKYKPIALEKTFNKVTLFEEDKVTKEYMARYGIDKVRGGSYVQMNLSEEQVTLLEREIRGAKDLCTKCGRSGHFVQDCYAKSNASGKKLEEDVGNAQIISLLKQVVKEVQKAPISTKKAYTTCYRCGNVGHYVQDCYASRHVNGMYLDDN